MIFKRVVGLASDGQGRDLGPWQGPRALFWLILLVLSGTPSLPFFPRPQPEPGVAMATSEEPISLVISVVQSLAWSCELPELPARGLLCCPQFLFWLCPVPRNRSLRTLLPLPHSSRPPGKHQRLFSFSPSPSSRQERDYGVGGDSGSLKYPYIEACIELMPLEVLFLLLPCSQKPRQLEGSGGLGIRLSASHP